jgi:predicted dehydrogenase
MVSPIRVGLIGLSASPTGTGWATSAHLPYLRKSPYYKITALLNSSVDNARKAVKAHSLGDDTKTYGSPEDLANDPNVDLVVVNTRVDRHAQVLLPSLLAGKDAFCEWPLDRNAEVARSMVDVAQSGGGKTITGLQGRFNPVVQTLRKLISDGRIGRPLSSTFIGSAGNGGATESYAIEYFVDRKVGGNILTIASGHSKKSD